MQYSYAGALHACMHLRDSEKAMDLLDEMEQMGMPANAESFATAIRTCARCGKPDEATYVYREALRLAVVPTKVGQRQCTDSILLLQRYPSEFRDVVVILLLWGYCFVRSST